MGLFIAFCVTGTLVTLSINNWFRPEIEATKARRIVFYIGNLFAYGVVEPYNETNDLSYVKADINLTKEEMDLQIVDYFESRMKALVEHYWKVDKDYYTWGELMFSWSREELNFRPSQVPVGFNQSVDEELYFFFGHGDMVEGEQRFLIDETSYYAVRLFNRTMMGQNITVIVDSCYSVNWHSNFTHTNLNALYTSDLDNTKEDYHLSFADGNIVRVSCYLSYFINCLILDYGYASANEESLRWDTL